MNVETFLESIKQDPSYAGQIVHVHREPAREPVWVPPPDGLNPIVKEFMSALGVDRLYRHQADAISAAIGGKDLVVTTSAASGKSLCYQVPVLEGLLDRPHHGGRSVSGGQVCPRCPVFHPWDRP